MMRKIYLLQAKVTRVLDVSNRMPLPLRFHSLLNQAFKCSVCLLNITPPVIVRKCCKRIIGCQVCTDRWYGGEDRMMKRCPLCHEEKGYVDTMILLGVEAPGQDYNHSIPLVH